MNEHDATVNFGNGPPVGYVAPNQTPWHQRPPIEEAGDSEEPDLESGLRAWGVMTPGDFVMTPALLGSELMATEPTPRRWLVNTVIPMAQVTLLSGDGGVGKSLLAIQLAISAASGCPWFGALAVDQMVSASRWFRLNGALVVACEDDAGELHRRVKAIGRSRGLEPSRLRGLALIPMAGEDARLISTDRQGVQTPTDFWQRVCHRVRLTRPKLMVLDTASHLFSGNENVRSEVTSFVQMLQGLAQDVGCAIVLLSHPSVAGMASGTGLSGSTGWNNSVRSRLYLKRDGDDPEVRILEQVKSNYGAVGESWRLVWREGVLHQQDASSGPSNQERDHDRVTLQCVENLNAQARRTSQFRFAGVASGMVEAGKLSKRHLNAALERLLASGAVEIVTVRENGKDLQDIRANNIRE
jgi:RecA-family ATPase